MSRLIGICGKARAGKDSVGEALVSGGFNRKSFAGPIRLFVCHLLGITLSKLEEIKEEPSFLGPSPRQMMQTLGTEWGRNMVAPDIWIKTALLDTEGDTVLTDVRFDNEAEAIIALGGEIWQVVRPGSGNVIEHESEKGISPGLVKHRIFNTGSMADLCLSVDKLQRRAQ